MSGLYTVFASAAALEFPTDGALLYVIGQNGFGAGGNRELLTGVGVAFAIYLSPDGLTEFLRRLFERAKRGETARRHKFSSSRRFLRVRLPAGEASAV